jgi:hypothetical protein
MRTLLAASVFGDVLSPAAAFATSACHEKPVYPVGVSRLKATEQASW